MLRPALAALAGVAEVATVGGETEEVVIDVGSERLRARGMSLGEVRAAVQAAARRRDARRAWPRSGSCRWEGRSGSARWRTSGSAAPWPPGWRRSGGQYPAVGGIVVAARGANVPRLLDAVHRTLAELRPRLPPGVTLLTVHDRSEVIDRIQGTLGRALLEEVAVLALVVLVFLLSPRAAAVPLLTLPAVRAAHRRRHATPRDSGHPDERGRHRDRPGPGGRCGGRGARGLSSPARAPRSPPLRTPSAAPRCSRRQAPSRPAILTSLLIAALSFLPVLGFEGETGRLLRPLAASKTLVIAAAALVALTLAPALRDRLLRAPVVPEFSNPLTAGLVRLYRPFVQVALSRPGWTLAIAGAALLSCLPLLPGLGREFLPRIDEGDLLFMPTTLPGAPEEELPLQLRFQDSALAGSPAVATVFGKMGRADTATDPAPLSMAETTVRLRPHAEWPRTSRAALVLPLGSARTAARARHGLAGGAAPGRSELVEELDRAGPTPGLDERLDRAGARHAWTWSPPGSAPRWGCGSAPGPRSASRCSEPRPRRCCSRLEGVRAATLESAAREPWATFEIDPAAADAWGVDVREARATAELLSSGGELGTLGGAGGRIGVRMVQDRGSRDVLAQLREATVPGRSGGRSRAIPLTLVGRPVVRAVPAHAPRGGTRARGVPPGGPRSGRRPHRLRPARGPRPGPRRGSGNPRAPSRGAPRLDWPVPAAGSPASVASAGLPRWCCSP